MTNDGEAYFEFIVDPGENAEFRYNGGTQGVCELGFLQTFGEKLEYIHNHSSIRISKRTNTNKDETIANKWRETDENIQIQDIEKLNAILANNNSKSITQNIYNIIRKYVTSLGIDMEQYNKSTKEESYKFLSSKLKLENSAKKGRFVVATEDIEAGEPVIAEQPILTFLHKSHMYSNCSVCLRPVLEAVTCNKCNQIIFCSQDCKEKGVFHNWECGFTDYIPAQGKVALVIRLFTSGSLDYFIENKSRIVSEVMGQADLNENKNINSIFQLQAGNRNDSMYNLTKFSWSYYILFALNQMGYFQNKDIHNFGAEHIFIAELADRLLRIADDNCHEICELDVPDENLLLNLQDICQGSVDIVKVIGAGIYPNISLFNNSCDVNTMKAHKSGTTEIITAKRKIQAGEEISDFYGENYFLSDKFARRNNLGFSCCCKACVENYPLRDDLPDFSEKDYQLNTQWALHRIELENQASSLEIKNARNTCLQMGECAQVTSPHEVLVVPEMYLTLANLIQTNNKSIRFMAWATQNNVQI